MLRWLFGAAEVLRAVATMVVIETCLRTTDLPTTCRRLRLAVDLTSAAPPATARTLLPRHTRRAVRASHAVVSRWPAGDTCLRRCLLVGHRLHGLDPVLRIGVARTADGRFAAHSWLEVGGRTLDPAAAAFATLGPVGG